MGSRTYFLGKVLQALLTLLLIVIFNFFLFRIIPGDPVKLLVRASGAELTQDQQNRLRHELGLDQPVFPQQFVGYMKDTATLKLGRSLFVDPRWRPSSTRT